MPNDQTADLKRLDPFPKSLFRNILRVSDLSSTFYEESGQALQVKLNQSNILGGIDTKKMKSGSRQ